REPTARFSTAREFVDEFCLAAGKSSGAPSSMRASSLFTEAPRPADGPTVVEAKTSSPSLHAASAALAEKPRRTSNAEDSGTLAAAPEQSVGGGTGSPRPRSMFRRVLLAIASLGVLGALGLAGAAYLGKLGKLGDLRFGPFRSPAASISSDSVV